MLESFKKFLSGLIQNEINFQNERFNIAIKSYDLVNITKEFDINENQKIYQNFKNSNLIVIKYYACPEKAIGKPFFIIIFKETIMIIELSSISFLQSFLSSNDQLKIYFSPGSKDIFNSKIKIQFQEFLDYENIDSEVSSLNEQLNLKGNKSNLFWAQSRKSLCSFLIKESYIKSEQDRLKKHEINLQSIKPRIFEEDEFVKLKMIGVGSSFYAILIYHFEYNKLMVLKAPKNESFDEISVLFEREKSNYSKLHHAFLPEYYGEVKNKQEIIIEFINGETLLKTKNIDFNEKILIIFEIGIIIQYLHSNNFIYRDLKPDNVMIDKHKTVVLIDLDRLILKEDIDKNVNNTQDFASSFVAPEIYKNNFSFECDVYSFGKMIYYILSKNVSESELNAIFEKHLLVLEIYKMCTNENPAKRNTIGYICSYFIVYFNAQIWPFMEKIDKNYGDKKDNNINGLDKRKLIISGNLLNIFYYEGQKNPFLFYQIGQYLEENVNKFQDFRLALHFYEKGANFNDPYSLDYLGKLYYKGIYVQKNVNKAIYYISLACKQNHLVSFYNLGVIYFNFPNEPIDMEKAIHYFTIATDRNMKEAQCILGEIYFDINVNKSIYYLTLAEKQNCSKSQYVLGCIYLYHNSVKHDINKAIEYFEKSANQNDIEALLILGRIYKEGIYVSTSIDKAIYYYSLAADQNDYLAQYFLGQIYESFDIEKSFHFYTLSANNNFSYAQVVLARFYLNNNNLSKATHYLKLAADQNNSDAQHLLGKLLVRQDIYKAIQYLTSSANQNNVNSLCDLGNIYYEGLFVPRDIQKSIYYLTKSAKLNFGLGQLMLARIYCEGTYVPKDIKRGIYLLKLALKNNVTPAAFSLGCIYENEVKNINKAIKYYLIGSEKNDNASQLNLGAIYFDGKYIKQDIPKAIYYFKLAAKSIPEAQFNLGLIYEKYVQNEIDQSIHYYTLAAKNNAPNAQYKLGYFYFEGKYVERNIEKGLLLLNLSSNNDFTPAHFMIGFLFHEGKHLKRDIFKAIEYYRKTTLKYYQYALNNLGVIYKNGFGGLIEKKIGYAIQYFTDAINKTNDALSMFNLAQIYLYEIQSEENLLCSIDLFIKSYFQNLFISLDLMIIALIKKFGYDFEKYEQLLKNYTKKSKELVKSIKEIIYSNNLINIYVFDYFYECHKNIDFLYNYNKEMISTTDIFNIKVNPININKGKDITNDFYEGFGID